MSKTFDSLHETQTNELQRDETSMDGPQTVDTETRRNFATKLFAGLIGALLMVVPLVSGVLFLFDPLRRRKAESSGDGFLFVTALDAVPTDGTPVRFAVIRDLVNAWNMYPKQPVGGIYLRRIGNQILAFNQICPHLGCAVDYRKATGEFYCPCHASTFKLDGKKKNVVPPRDLDSLDAEVRNEKEIWVKYQNFRGATTEKVPLS